ncbi:MAG: FKBP-type peptidyl-prolyl cis-trans isomerase [Flavobacteriales bacterium]
MKLVSAIAAISLMFSACSSAQENKEEGTEMNQDAASGVVEVINSPSGLVVEILKQGEGDKPQTGDIVKVHYTGTLKANGEKFDSSLDRGEPIEFPLGIGKVILGWEEGIGLLNRGTKARLIIPSALGYGSRAAGPIPANSDLVFEVELIDFKPGPRPIAHEVFSTEGLKPTTTGTGLQYYIIEKGSGPKAENGKTVTVHYHGYFKDGGQKFDSSYERGEPFPVQLGARQVIPGWEEGLSYLGVGDKAVLVIPYNLAYGEQGYPGVIPPKADLMFDIEVIDIH